MAEVEHDQGRPGAPTGRKSKLDAIGSVVAMIRTLTVPAVALFLIVAFFRPISEIATILPSKFREAGKLSAGGFLLEVQRTAERAGNPELAEMIGDLSQPSLRYLLNAPEGKRFLLLKLTRDDGTQYYPLPNKRELDAIAELELKKLFECGMPIRTWQSQFLEEMSPTTDQYGVKYAPKQGTDASVSLNISCERTFSGEAAVNLIIGVVTREIAAARSGDARTIAKSGQE